ncbi:hypothetical protein [Dyella japonica]|uniref:PXPV repeat-containing protein n=1 Tax=Dyella japonica TaxID=231455 RepID=A0ABV2JWS5_9GAMM
MKRFVLAQRVVLGLAVAATAAAPMAASARDGWGHDGGYGRGHGDWHRDRGDWHRGGGYYGGGYYGGGHHGGHGNAGAWIAGAIAVAAVAGIVQQATAPAPVYYQPAPTYYQPATTYYQQPPTVVYRQSAPVVYQQPPQDDGQVIYEQPTGGYQNGYQDDGY